MTSVEPLSTQHASVPHHTYSNFETSPLCVDVGTHVAHALCPPGDCAAAALPIVQYGGLQRRLGAHYLPEIEAECWENGAEDYCWAAQEGAIG